MAGRFVDSTTSLDAAAFNDLIIGDGGQYMMMGWRIYYNGSTWVVATNIGSQTATLPGVTWNGTSHYIDIDLSSTGLGSLRYSGSDYPVAVTSPSYQSGANPSHRADALATSATNIRVDFWQVGSGPALVKVTTEDQRMDFNIMVMGVYA